MRYYFVRNQDLLFDIVTVKRDMVDSNLNYLWLDSKNRAALLRGGHRAHRLGHRKEDNVDGDQRQHSTDRERQRLVAHQPALLEQVAV